MREKSTQSLSYSIHVLAAVRLIPNPPALVLRRKILNLLSISLKSWICLTCIENKSMKHCTSKVKKLQKEHWECIVSVLSSNPQTE